MRQPRDHLRRDFASSGLLQGDTVLGFLGHIHRQDIDPAVCIGGKGSADAPGAHLVREFDHRRLSGKGLGERGGNRVVGLLTQNLCDMAADQIRAPPRHDRGQPPV